ncbi:HXXEE domain-containing protein [Sporosarcina thermotolerans]|uniref:HXXEE domain-containing protein n=1 Tax=Sporosarcina thermotolerans TaxID=633404 RepID=A0AAW9AF91_9BACL|nr:HXXEE domain-containing protein [Sporosarcina thermotolerans]MDW0118356.1 HXXEE domain-containing protein [Sporosarcina thermotolerans]WHT49410.1 HXXEE domain-containing protein [Sporosarcina thermotolerans]
MDINVWIISFLIIFMLHNLEEIIMVEKWIKKTYPRVRDKIPSSMQKELNHYNDITSVQFAVIVFVFSIFASILILIAVVTQHYYLFLGVNLFFALNIFTHPLQALYLRCYTPGLLTSLLLIIPYYSLFFYRFYNTDMLSLNSILGAIAVMIIFIPLFLLSHKIGKKWN